MSGKKTEVLFCTDGIFPHAVGGMQRHSRLLVEALAGMEDLDLKVIHPHEGIKVFNNPSITEIVAIPDKPSGRYLVDCWRYSKKVLNVATSYPGAVIYSQGLSVWYQIHKLRNRVIVNPHGLEPYQTLSARDYLIGTPFRLIFNHLFKKAARVVSLGGRLTGILEKHTRKGKIAVLPNAVNVPDLTERNFENTAAKIQFLFVGRFALNKGINILAQAVKELNDEGYSNKLTFNLVGKGPLFDTYIKQYAFPNLNFLGFADDARLNELYRTNDVFVLPTLFEGMPTVVLEAMAHGMPIIVTDVGATLEMVDETNGFIIEKNDVNSLKKAILRYIALSPSEKKSLSMASYKKVKDKFTWKIIAEKHAGLFKELGAAVK
jgi:glycosyltransferase involved in cell wall biosynthesis